MVLVGIVGTRLFRASVIQEQWYYGACLVQAEARQSGLRGLTEAMEITNVNLKFLEQGFGVDSAGSEWSDKGEEGITRCVKVNKRKEGSLM